MATVTQIQQQVEALAVRTANEIDRVDADISALGGGVTPTTDWANITNKPTEFTPSAHTHTSSAITDFNAAVDARIDLADLGGGTPAWADITGKPTEFPPEDHTHVVADITDFATEVNALIADAGAGDGNVSGPAGGVVNNEIAVYNGTSGIAIKGSGIVPSADGISLIEAADYAAMRTLLSVSTGDVVGPAGGVVDSEIAVYSGTGGKTLKASGITPSANGIALIEGANYAAMRTQLGLVIGTDVQAWAAKTDAVAALTWAADKVPYFTSASALSSFTISSFMRGLLAASDSNSARSGLDDKESLIVALGDESTAVTTTGVKTTIRMPYAVALDLPTANCNTASTSGLPVFDVKVNGVSIFTTKITLDANEKTSVTAATPAVMTTTPYSIAADAEVTFSIDTTGTGMKGPKINLVMLRL